MGDVHEGGLCVPHRIVNRSCPYSTKKGENVRYIPAKFGKLNPGNREMVFNIKSKLKNVNTQAFLNKNPLSSSGFIFWRRFQGILI